MEDLNKEAKILEETLEKLEILKIHKKKDYILDFFKMTGTSMKEITIICAATITSVFQNLPKEARKEMMEKLVIGFLNIPDIYSSDEEMKSSLETLEKVMGKKLPDDLKERIMQGKKIIQDLRDEMKREGFTGKDATE